MANGDERFCYKQMFSLDAKYINFVNRKIWNKHAGALRKKIFSHIISFIL